MVKPFGRGVDLTGRHEVVVCKTLPVSSAVSERFRAVDVALPIGETRALIRLVPDSEF